MARGAVRGAFTAWLALIALQTIGTRGSGRVAEALNDANTILQRALDPKIPAIPNLAAGEKWGAGTYSAPPRVKDPNDNIADLGVVRIPIPPIPN